MIHIIAQFSHFDILSAVELWCVCGGFGWRWRVGALRLWFWIPESASEGELAKFFSRWKNYAFLSKDIFYWPRFGFSKIPQLVTISLHLLSWLHISVWNWQWNGNELVDIAKGTLLQDPETKSIGVAAGDFDGDGREEVRIEFCVLL